MNYKELAFFVEKHWTTNHHFESEVLYSLHQNFPEFSFHGKAYQAVISPLHSYDEKFLEHNSSWSIDVTGVSNALQLLNLHEDTLVHLIEAEVQGINFYKLAKTLIEEGFHQEGFLANSLCEKKVLSFQLVSVDKVSHIPIKKYLI